MRPDPMQMERLAGEEEYAAGRELEESGSVKAEGQDGTRVRYTVAGKPPRTVTLDRDLEIRCDCETFAAQGCCRHAVAAWLEAERAGIPENLLKKSAPARAEELTDLILREMPAEANVRIEVTLALGRKEGQEARIGLRAGGNKLYVVKDLQAFLTAMEDGKPVTFGKDFIYEPDWMHFSGEDERVFNLLRKLFSAQAENGKDKNGRMVPMPDPFVKELLEEIGETPLRIMDRDGGIIRCRQIRQAKLPLQFTLNMGPRGLNASARMPADFLPVTADCAWAMTGGRLIETDRSQRELIRMIWRHQYEGRCLFQYPLDQTGRVISEVLPYLKVRGAVEMGESLRSRLVRMPLKSQVYLDRDGKSVTAAVVFRYGEIELNPFAPEDRKIAIGKDEKLLLRDAEAEHTVLEILANAGFRVRKDHIRLSGSDPVFDFVSEGVRKLQEASEVFLSKDFKRILPKRSTLSGSMRMNGDKLELMLEKDGEPMDEILELMEALSRRRRYFRLKNGDFLDLTALAEWQELAAGIYEAAQRDGSETGRDVLELRAYRAWYLNSMLENSRIPIQVDESVKKMAESVTQGDGNAAVPPLAPGLTLRGYQLRGYEWMCALDRMRMGGILADDMGLGKTVQVIALLQTARENGRTSLIVAPTSLTYNWLSEIRRFAPELSCVILNGTAQQRSVLIRHIAEHGDVDVAITSYPLIRRDAEMLKEIRFRFLILDEAQNIKNAGSVAAQAVKQLQGDTRFALTGTPMENGVGELWSLFDFVLPGYLPGYNSFLRKYQDGENAADLLRRIRPFLTRRLKQEVLEELPDKMEITLRAQMTPEQNRIYRAALERLRPKINELIDSKGVDRSRIEVLSAITELREICCHPSLVMNDYRGGSGKEDLLLDMLPEMISNGRRILLFSQFTSMLKILRTRLEENGFSTMYLDGETPADERLELAERFNGGESQIFLISLRAGGYGLNLTGADLVIHYDPWWNPATEDQATDRAHRIGQQKKVQVIRLVTGESIEEQVVELGNRKKALFERLITPGESALNALTEQDIRALFS